jgi:predicted TIM-barrel fold metal-dependent hydrolase
MTPFSGDERRKMYSMKPSEYFHRNCAIGATYTDALGWVPPEQRKILGYKSLMWGSDYPHMESAWPHTKQKLRELMEGIDHDEAKAMIGGNAVEVYKLDSRKLEQTAARIGPRASEILSA